MVFLFVDHLTRGGWLSLYTQHIFLIVHRTISHVTRFVKKTDFGQVIGYEHNQPLFHGGRVVHPQHFSGGSFSEWPANEPWQTIAGQNTKTIFARLSTTRRLKCEEGTGRSPWPIVFSGNWKVTQTRRNFILTFWLAAVKRDSAGPAMKSQFFSQF